MPDDETTPPADRVRELQQQGRHLAEQAAEVAEYSAQVHEEAAEVHERMKNPRLDPQALRDHAERDRAFAEHERRQAAEDIE